jgi:hypothetical protein
MRKLINTWIGGPLNGRLRSRIVREVSAQLVSLRKFIPAEFARKTRSLRELDRYKATEFRLFLLYVGPVLLLGKLPTAQYKHFLLLHCASYVLVNENTAKKDWNSFAQTLILKFIKMSGKLYGKKFLV